MTDTTDFSDVLDEITERARFSGYMYALTDVTAALNILLNENGTTSINHMEAVEILKRLAEECHTDGAKRLRDRT